MRALSGAIPDCGIPCALARDKAVYAALVSGTAFPSRFGQFSARLFRAISEPVSPGFPLRFGTFSEKYFRGGDRQDLKLNFNAHSLFKPPYMRAARVVSFRASRDREKSISWQINPRVIF